MSEPEKNLKAGKKGRHRVRKIIVLVIVLALVGWDCVSGDPETAAGQYGDLRRLYHIPNALEKIGK